jgi:hypothetical protein
MLIFFAACHYAAIIAAAPLPFAAIDAIISCAAFGFRFHDYADAIGFSHC